MQVCVEPLTWAMCGRYLIKTPPETLAVYMGYTDRPNFPPRYNIAPTQPVPIVRLDQGQRRFALVRWGLVPSWAKDMPASLLINARAESIADKPSFRGAFRHRRCLVPADGFYEWRVMGQGAKQPYCIRLKSGEPFAMAGIWETWMTPDGSELDSCAIITTDANETLKPIHHRMPAILAPQDYDRWLDPNACPPRAALDLLRPAPDEWLEAYPVSTRVNKVANDNPDLIEPVALETLSPPTAVAEKQADNDQLSLL